MWLLLFVLLVLLIVDQLSKWYFESIDLVVINNGGVWGLFPGDWWGLLMIGVWVVILILMIRAKEPWAKCGLGLILVGGLGNILDRLMVGGVRDFIYYPGLEVYGNIADIILTVGIIWLIVGEVYYGRKKQTGS